MGKFVALVMKIIKNISLSLDECLKSIIIDIVLIHLQHAFVDDSVDDSIE